MKKYIFLPILILSISVPYTFASDHSETYNKAQTTCSNYTTHLENYLDTTLPVYLDEKVTKSNQKSIEVYKTILKEKEHTKVSVVVLNQTTKVDFIPAELLNIWKKSYIAGFIYNPFWYWDQWKHNTNFQFMQYTPENIKKFVLNYDEMTGFCGNIEMFAYDDTFSSEDNEVNNKLMKQKIQEMSAIIKKQTIEMNKIKNNKISSTIIKNTNLSLWKLKYIVERLHILGAEG